MTEPTLRDYRSASAADSRPEDWRAMHALDELCFAAPFRFTRRAMRRFAETPGAITLLAESSGQLVGFAIAHLESEERDPQTSDPQASDPQSAGTQTDPSQSYGAQPYAAQLPEAQPYRAPAAQLPAGRVAYVVTLDVAPDWRRRGLARRLMHALELRAHAAGADAIALHVFPGNLAALQLYEALGYQRIGVAADFYGDGLDALVYRKQLERKQSG